MRSSVLSNYIRSELSDSFRRIPIFTKYKIKFWLNFKVFSMVTVQIVVFWDMTPRSLADGHRNLGETWWLHLQGWSAWAKRHVARKVANQIEGTGWGSYYTPEYNNPKMEICSGMVSRWGVWRRWLPTVLGTIPGSHREIEQNHSWDNRQSGHDSSQAPRKYESRTLPLQYFLCDR
jgi:hypothetical protein